MALKKQKEVKGFTSEYWKVTNFKADLMTCTLTACLSLFKDKYTRDSDNSAIMKSIGFKWIIPEEFETIAQITVLELVSYIYTKIKESKPEIKRDENGLPMFEPDGVTPIMEETNWFNDAEDVLEIPLDPSL